MARPIKNNADYFPHDADMRNDPKVKALRRKFGHTGYSVWNMLLEFLTDSDNFEFEFSELQIELISGDFDLEPGTLKEIILYCEKVKLITVEDGFLQSKRLKERFSPLLNKRERDRKRVFASENTQSKVNESKVKESKENIINNSIDNNSSKINFSDLENEQWFLSIRSFLDNKVSYIQIKNYWKKYQEAMIADDDLYRDAKDYRSHFRNWVKIQAEKQKNNSTLMKPTGILNNA